MIMNHCRADRIFHRNLVKLAENRKCFFYDNMSYQLHALMISYIEKYNQSRYFIESHTAILNSF